MQVNLSDLDNKRPLAAQLHDIPVGHCDTCSCTIGTAYSSDDIARAIQTAASSWDGGRDAFFVLASPGFATRYVALANFEPSEPRDPNFFGGGKFSSELDERLWSMSMDGVSEEIGTTDDIGWHGFFLLGTDDLLSMGAIDFAESMPTDENGRKVLPHGALVATDDRGFVYTELYATEQDYDAAIAEVQKHHDIFFADYGTDEED